MFFSHLLIFFFFVFYYTSGILINLSFIFFDSVSLDFVFVFDFLSLRFSSFILLISSVVFVYSNFYMIGDNNILRFFLILFLFVISIMFLVFGRNMFTLILGWDGLGIVSFLLVVYYRSFSSLRSGLLTVLSNRLGDLGMLFSFFLLFWRGWWGVLSFSLKEYYLLSLLIIFSGITKRAQFPFSSWLPAAIAAPTPVSSLVHSSTLVTAGVYLLIRFYYSLSFFLRSTFFCVISIITIFFRGILAILDSDIKKVVAISTLRQLGFIIFSISIGEWIYGFFHIVCHALYKSLLFLRAGSFIIFSFGGQDLRFKGGILYSSPFFFLVFVFSSMRLFGFPFLTGFFSKDFILEISFTGGWGIFILFILILSCSFSLVYSIRLYFFGLYNYMNMPPYISFFSLKSSISFLFILFFWSIFWGFYFGSIIFLDNYFFIFSFLKLLGAILFLIGGLIFCFFFIFYNFRIISMESSDFFFLYWFSGWPISINRLLWGYFNFNDSSWLEFFGPKSFLGFMRFSLFLNFLEKSFFKIIYLFIGFLAIYFLYISIFWMLNRALGLLLIGS